MRLYGKADRNKDGHVDVKEFAAIFDIEKNNPFLPRLVQLFDVSGDGQMSVFEFIVCLSQFSKNKSHQEHIYFAWRLFDTDDSGSLTKEEFVRVISGTYAYGGGAKVNTHDRKGKGLANFGGTGGKAKGVESILRAMDEDGNDEISIKEFVKILKKFSHFMAPAFDLWDKMQTFSGPCTKMYREVKAAGNVTKLMAYANESATIADRGGGDDDALAYAAGSPGLYGEGLKKTKGGRSSSSGDGRGGHDEEDDDDDEGLGVLMRERKPVSYTHLTLPTILLV